jgi:sentrin-specific protease 8
MRDSSSSGFHPFNGKLSRRFEGITHLSSDGAYLSYYDVLLTREDVDTLRHNDWLTDNVISFWEEWLEREHLSKHLNAAIVLLRPSMCFLLVQTADPSSLKGALPDFSKTTHIFLPINDCHDPTRPEGGSHWSLLLVSIKDGVAFHYDSLASANESDARRVAAKLATLLNMRLTFRDLDDSPQQENGSDCGVFVCSVMRYLLLQRLLVTSQGIRRDMSMADFQPKAAKERREMVQIIEGFRREGVRRRS